MNTLRNILYRLSNREERKALRLRRTASERLFQLVSSRATITLDRLGLADLSDFGLSRRQVFDAMHDLVVQNLVIVQASGSGHVILCSPAAAERTEAESPAVTKPSRAAGLSSRPRERRNQLHAS